MKNLNHMIHNLSFLILMADKYIGQTDIIHNFLSISMITFQGNLCLWQPHKELSYKHFTNTSQKVIDPYKRSFNLQRHNKTQVGLGKPSEQANKLPRPHRVYIPLQRRSLCLAQQLQSGSKNGKSHRRWV